MVEKQEQIKKVESNDSPEIPDKGDIISEMLTLFGLGLQKGNQID